MSALAGQLWTAIRPTNPRQRFLGWCGTLLLASGLVHAVVAAVDGSSWWGAVSWRKPTVFGLSVGLFLWSMVWVLRQLPVRPRLERLVVSFIGLTFTIEVILITIQQWRGVPSHFNRTTVPDRAIFITMGLGIAFVAAGVVVLLVWSLVEFRGDAAARLTVVMGLSGIVAAGLIGKQMLTIGKAEMKATGQAPDRIMIGAEGSAKLAHAIGLHGIQVLALLCIGLALGTLPAYARLRLMALAAAGFAAVFAAVTVTAEAGRAVTDPTAPMAVLGLLGLSALATVAVVAGLSLRRAPHGNVPGHRTHNRPTGDRRPAAHGPTGPGKPGTPGRDHGERRPMTVERHSGRSSGT